MVTLDLIVPSIEAIEETIEIIENTDKGNMLMPIIMGLVIVALAVVIISKVVISKGIKSAK